MILVNFHEPDISVVPSLAVSSKKRKSSRWKRRLRERKRVGREIHTSKNSHQVGTTNINFNSPETQKLFCENFTNAHLPNKKATKFTNQINKELEFHTNKIPHDEKMLLKPGLNRSTCKTSSLFSFNPTILSKDINNLITDTEPSNAIPSDSLTFGDIGICSSLTQALSMINLKTPTIVQRQSIPLLIKSVNDVFIHSQTGSGKTLAYVVPIINYLMSFPINRTLGCFAVILTPTRELCRQVFNTFEKLLPHFIIPCLLIGGENRKKEKSRMRKGCNVLIATPGRMSDHLENTNVCKVNKVRWIVLDEADRLVDMGFKDKIKVIIDTIDSRINSANKYQLPQKRITIFCSATIGQAVREFANESLHNSITIHDDNLISYMAPAQLMQSVCFTPAKLRLVTLASFLQIESKTRKKLIVFFSCTSSVDFHYALFAKSNGQSIAAVSTLQAINSNVPLFKLHGSLSQTLRNSTLNSFINASNGVLFCTDVAARGLDLLNLDFIIEFDPPFSLEDHFHRVGRTARAGNHGRSCIFLLPGCEEQFVRELQPAHQNMKYELALNILQQAFGNFFETDVTNWQISVEGWVNDDSMNLSLARNAYISHIRAYTTHSLSMRHIFSLKALHLGHIAKSFGLRDTPEELGSFSSSKNASLVQTEKKSFRKHMNINNESNKIGLNYNKANIITEFNLG